MGNMPKLFSVMLALCVAVAAAYDINNNIAAAANGNNDLINRVCNLTPSNKDVCVEILHSDPVRSQTGDITDLAIISLKVAAKNASGLLSDVKMLIDDPNLDPDVQQGLADCKETILDAESQLEDTIASLLLDSDVDPQVWLKAALAAITTCDDSIPGSDDVLSVKSRMFRNLCNIVVAITKALPKNAPPPNSALRGVAKQLTYY